MPSRRKNLSAGFGSSSVRRIRELTDRPFGANASLLFPGAAQNAKILLDEKVPVINFALGKGDWIVKRAHEYGGKVLATVINHRHAQRAQDYGTDGVIVTGHEAAAHGGDVTTFVLIPSIADAVKIPVIAAGGIGDGRGLAAALALGADGIAMGTRFMSTRESPLHNAYKALSVEKEVYDTLYSERFDGLPCRVLKTPAAEKAIKDGLSLVQAISNSRDIARNMRIPYLKLCMGVLASGWQKTKELAHMANAFKAIQLATEAGDTNIGVLPVGQITGLIKDLPTVSEMIERIVSEAEAIQKKMAGMMAG
jgi:enoyl-[acyl-carrier protein] reductase II